jgi:hypothetical protein
MKPGFNITILGMNYHCLGDLFPCFLKIHKSLNIKNKYCISVLVANRLAGKYHCLGDELSPFGGCIRIFMGIFVRF